MSGGFELFSPWHVGALAATAGVAAAVPVVAHRRRSATAARRASLGIATALLVVETGKVLARWLLLGWSLGEALPLHLCGIASYLTAIVLLTGSRALFGVVYFWAVGGTLLALLTPDLPVPLPEPMALGFFASHGLVLVGIAHACFGLGMRPGARDVFASWLALNAYALLLLPVNAAAGTNFLYLAAKPEAATLLDRLGPWPWYLLACEAIALGQCLLWWLPWELARRGDARRQSA